MRETEVWQKLKRCLARVHWQRIETVTSAGVPDVNGCLDGVEFWIELKVLTGTRKLRFQHDLKPTQVAWLTKRWMNGGKTFIMAICPEDNLWVWTGYQAREIKKFGPGVVEPIAKLRPPFNSHDLTHVLCDVKEFVPY